MLSEAKWFIEKGECSHKKTWKAVKNIALQFKEEKLNKYMCKVLRKKPRYEFMRLTRELRFICNDDRYTAKPSESFNSYLQNGIKFTIAGQCGNI